MRVVVVTPPAPVVTLARAKVHLNVDHGDDDALIENLIEAATRNLDGPDGWLGRALGRQELRLFIEPDDIPDCYPRGVALPYPPTRSQDAIVVTGVTTGATADVLSSTHYRLDGPARRLDFDFGALPWGVSAAVTYETGTPVPVDGEGASTDEPAPVAAEVVAALLLTVGSLYENRAGDVIDARAVVAENPAVERLLVPQRVWRT